MNIEMGLKEERKTYLILILFSNSRSWFFVEKFDSSPSLAF
jgi:hypothetical protein